MIRRRLAILREGGVGGDRFDAQKRKQPLQAVVEIGIDAIKNRLKLDVWHLRRSLPGAANFAVRCITSARS
jgi:hypothetical protein